MSTETKGKGAFGATDPHKVRAPNMFEGILVSMSGNKLVMSNAEGREYSHTLANDAKLTCDGKTCKANDLPTGGRIRVTTEEDDRHTVTCVEAIVKEGRFATPCSS
ncbi:MAG TPA: hypothetical protein PKD54_01715 [Pirellulaceae bacterium]|nr:hypothetical protein [Pirellulaceae bacterium]